MATFNYSVRTDSGGAYIDYCVMGLQYTWGSGVYNRFGIGNQSFTSGTYSWSWLYPSSSNLQLIGDGYSLIYPSTVQSTDSGTTSLYGWMRLTRSMRIYPYLGMNGWDSTAGTQDAMWGVTETGSVAYMDTHPGIYIEVNTLVRPSLFYWSTYGTEPPNSTSVLWIPKATAWNGLRTNIIQLLVYKGLLTNASDFYDSALPVVSSGTPPTAAMYNQAVYYINYMHGGTYLSYVTAGVTPMTAYYWYQLQYYINGIG